VGSSTAIGGTALEDSLRPPPCGANLPGRVLADGRVPFLHQSRSRHLQPRPRLSTRRREVLRAIVWWRTGSIDRATCLAADLGKGFAVALMFLGAMLIFRGALLGGIWLIFIGYVLERIGGAGIRADVPHAHPGVGEGKRGDDPGAGDGVPGPDLSDLVNRYFLRYGYRGFPVEEGEGAVGLISIDDLAGVPESELAARTVRDMMRSLDASRVISKDDPLLEALERLSPPNVGRLLVLEDGRLSGIITKTGLLRLLEIHQILKR